jgi:hypothetical protein
LGGMKERVEKTSRQVEIAATMDHHHESLELKVRTPTRPRLNRINIVPMPTICSLARTDCIGGFMGVGSSSEEVDPTSFRRNDEAEMMTRGREPSRGLRESTSRKRKKKKRKQ